MKEKNQLDILIPVFNEDETIIKTLKNILFTVKYNYKILICYDYDEDPTLEIVKKNLCYGCCTKSLCVIKFIQFN